MNRRERAWIRIAAVAALLGGAVWLWKGVELSLLPVGRPEENVYRASHGFMPWFGAALACVGIGATGLYASLPAKRKVAKWACATTIAGNALFLFGALNRMSMDMSVQYEPFQPIGFLVSIVGLLAFGIAVARTKPLSGWVRALPLAGAASLFAFNDQFVSSWASVPFGLVWIAASVHLFRHAAGGREKRAADASLSR